MNIIYKNKFIHQIEKENKSGGCRRCRKMKNKLNNVVIRKKAK